MHFACWILKGTNTHTHTDCVILIVFPQHQWFLECAPMLCFMYIACIVNLWIGPGFIFEPSS
jgi:hypothetical protein